LFSPFTLLLVRQAADRQGVTDETDIPYLGTIPCMISDAGFDWVGIQRMSYVAMSTQVLGLTF